MKLIPVGIIIILSLGITSCGLRYIDAPSPNEEDRWIKNGFTKQTIRSALVDCGYDIPKWSVSQQEQVDTCMLSKAFVFIDSPYGQQGAQCKHASYQHLPSCQSLKNQRK